MEPIIINKNDMYYAVRQDPRHIWTVKFNPANGVYFIKNTRTGKEWQMVAYEFIYRSMGFNPEVNRFPGYVHGQVWMLNEHHAQTRLRKSWGYTCDE